MSTPDLESWALFLAVADGGGLRAAARSAGVSVPTVSRALGRLEARLGAALFHRTSRRLSLTALGEQALDEARAVLAAAEALEERLAESRAMPAGRVRLAAPLDFGRAHLEAPLAGFLAAHPAVRVDLHLDDAVIDLVGSGHDLVLRIGRLDPSSLIARALCPVALLTVASPRFLAGLGAREPADLSGVAGLLYANSATPATWRLRRGDETGDAEPAARLCANSGGVLAAAARAGLGVALLPDFLVADDLASGRLVEALPGWRPEPLALNLVTPPSPLRPTRVRLLMDWLIAAFRDPPWR
jgi:DNA-binding transcriptional LysR family regulator